jgi:hypothetical protein
MDKQGKRKPTKNTLKSKQINTKTAAASQAVARWEPSREASENHAPPKDGLSAVGNSGIVRNHRGLVRKVEEGAGESSTHRLSP